MTTKDQSPLPCAHCGNKALGPTNHKGTFGFMCSFCGSRVDGYETPWDALTVWNKRADQPRGESWTWDEIESVLKWVGIGGIRISAILIRLRRFREAAKFGGASRGVGRPEDMKGAGDEFGGEDFPSGIEK